MWNNWMPNWDRLGLKENSSKVTLKEYDKGIQDEQNKIQNLKSIWMYGKQYIHMNISLLMYASSGHPLMKS